MKRDACSVMRDKEVITLDTAKSRVRLNAERHKFSVEQVEEKFGRYFGDGANFVQRLRQNSRLVAQAGEVSL